MTQHESLNLLPRNELLFDKIAKEKGEEEAEHAHEAWQNNAIGNLQTLNQATHELCEQIENSGDLRWMNDQETGEAVLIGRPQVIDPLEKALANVMGWKGEEIAVEPIDTSKHSLRISAEILGAMDAMQTLVPYALIEAVKKETGRALSFEPEVPKEQPEAKVYNAERFKRRTISMDCQAGFGSFK